MFQVPGVLGRSCLHQLSRAAFSLCCPFAIWPCQRGEFHQGQASFPHPRHNPRTQTWQECLHTICSMRGYLSLQGDYPEWVTAGPAPRAGPSAAPHWKSSRSMVQHLPGLCGDSQQVKTRAKLSSSDGQRMKSSSLQGKGFHPQSGLFADSASSIIIAGLIPTLPTRQLPLWRLHSDGADCKAQSQGYCKAQSQEYCIAILQIARYNLFFSLRGSN